MVEAGLLTQRPPQERFPATAITKGETFAWVSQGIVVYVLGSLEPVWGELIALWSALSRTLSPFRHARLWDELTWKELPDAASEAQLRSQVEATAGKRHGWKVELLSDRSAPQTSLEFRDGNQALGNQCASYLRIRLPLDTPPERLLELVTRMAEVLPVWHGSAGYVFNVVESERALAYDQVWAWARRYWGVQVVDPVTAVWDAGKGLLGINWLTLLGNEFLRERAPQLCVEKTSDEHVSISHSSRAAIVQAGERPLIGDLNVFEELAPYIQASHLLSGALIEEATEFPGMFTDQESTSRWMYRFENPHAWLDPDLPA